MSIVEKAVDKLKTTHPGMRPEPVQQEAFSRPEPVARPVADADSGATVRPATPVVPIGSDRGADAVHIDFESLRDAGMYPSEDNSGHIADQYRRIKRPLLANITGKGATQVTNGRRIMVASSVPGEGKTFTSFNLALSIALERDYTALLIDGDVAKCDMTRILNMEDRPGLLDLLGNERLQLENVVAQTDVPRLKVLPAGQWNTISTELLASRRMDHVLDEITRSMPNCIIVFDSPPLLATSEAQVLAAAMGQIVVVVAAGRTSQQTVKAGVETLDADKSINMVLNFARGGGDGKRYGNYYYGGYYSKGGPQHV
ncbi:MAG TPA: AAA family ATPase [Gammaproteobacteria bacterium]|jgi:receptor protein-tyrosine kinase|nr:AAA family ATPase [Gammaproteobacteria bacterium]